jgi:hypothetical protein
MGHICYRVCSMAFSCDIWIYRDAIFLTRRNSYMNISSIRYKFSCTLRCGYGTKGDFSSRTVTYTTTFSPHRLNAIKHKATSYSKPIKTFTCLSQNFSWDLTGMLSYPVDYKYVTMTLTLAEHVMFNTQKVQVFENFILYIGLSFSFPYSSSIFILLIYK